MRRYESRDRFSVVLHSGSAGARRTASTAAGRSRLSVLGTPPHRCRWVSPARYVLLDASAGQQRQSEIVAAGRLTAIAREHVVTHGLFRIFPAGQSPCQRSRRGSCKPRSAFAGKSRRASGVRSHRVGRTPLRRRVGELLPGSVFVGWRRSRVNLRQHQTAPAVPLFAAALVNRGGALRITRYPATLHVESPKVCAASPNTARTRLGIRCHCLTSIVAASNTRDPPPIVS